MFEFIYHRHYGVCSLNNIERGLLDALSGKKKSAALPRRMFFNIKAGGRGQRQIENNNCRILRLRWCKVCSTNRSENHLVR